MCTSAFGQALDAGSFLTHLTANTGGFGKAVQYVEDPLDLAGNRKPAVASPDPYPTNPAPNAPVAADEAAAAATSRERRRAALRYGRASTIGAGSTLAPSGPGKMLVGM